MAAPMPALANFIVETRLQRPGEDMAANPRSIVAVIHAALYCVICQSDVIASCVALNPRPAVNAQPSGRTVVHL